MLWSEPPAIRNEKEKNACGLAGLTKSITSGKAITAGSFVPSAAVGVRMLTAPSPMVIVKSASVARSGWSAACARGESAPVEMALIVKAKAPCSRGKPRSRA
ncbi:MAG: hypothetical protein ACYTEZ_20325 [Planctomycetota bacterium]